MAFICMPWKEYYWGINNLFNSVSVAYSPVSLIIINDIQILCIMDTDANVSVIDKNYATKHNVPLHTAPGHLVPCWR